MLRAHIDTRILDLNIYSSGIDIKIQSNNEQLWEILCQQAFNLQFLIIETRNKVINICKKRSMYFYKRYYKNQLLYIYIYN